MAKFEKVNLTSDVQYSAKKYDSTLKNPWGIVLMNDTLWVAVNGSGTLQNYSLEGKLLNSVMVDASSGISAPTGLVKYHKDKFLITDGTVSLPSKLITVTENGTINGYNYEVNKMHTKIAFSDPTKVFKGCDIYNGMLYVTNFASGHVEIYNGSWTFMKHFTDPALFAIGYAPYNVKIIDKKVFVCFAEQDSAKHDGIPGIGNGYVDVFDLSGSLDLRFSSRDSLNEPWAIIPYCIDINKKKKNVVVIGNFGDGRINIFSSNGKLIGCATDCRGNPYTLDSLWGLTKDYDENIYFAAGINNESDGMIGILKC
jgi:uncharacterized protein (TIGR03118 family)